MTNIIIEKKLGYYSNKIIELENTDINAEVEKRLAEKRAEITEIVKKEIETDIEKCKYYVEILNEIKDEMKSEVEESLPNDEQNNLDVETVEYTPESNIEGV